MNIITTAVIFSIITKYSDITELSFLELRMLREKIEKIENYDLYLDTCIDSIIRTKLEYHDLFIIKENKIILNRKKNKELVEEILDQYIDEDRDKHIVNITKIYTHIKNMYRKS